MLPKVATQILHHTSRAAAAIQNQTTQTIRNALSTSSSSASANSPWSTTGSSHWGSHGTGPGGAKYGSAGSRFYHGAGRAVTQANMVSSQDGIVGQSEEEELVPKSVTIRMKSAAPRPRRHSLSAASPEQPHFEHREGLGVLKSVQLHYARTRQTLGQLPSKSEQPALIRRNSTSAAVTHNTQPDSHFPLSVSPKSPARPASSHPTNSQPSVSYLAIQKALDEARAKKDPGIVAAAVRQVRAARQDLSIKEFNLCLYALHQTRRPGEPLTLLLETYNDLLSRSILPNVRTYITLILALTDRDFEVQKISAQLDARIKYNAVDGMYAVGPTESVDTATDAARIDQLRSETNFGSAMALFEAILAINGNSSIPPVVYLNLLRSCAYHANVQAAIHIYAQFEQRELNPTAAIFTMMMSTYINAGDLDGAKAIFGEFRAASREGRLAWLGDEGEVDVSEAESNAGLNRTAIARKAQLLVWNKMIEAYFRANQPAEAITILEQMMDSKADANYGPADIPPPASSTYTAIITGFISSGDVASALRWFDNLVIQTVAAPNPFAPMGRPPRPDQVAWITMLDALGSAKMVDDLNRLFQVLVDIASQDGLIIRPADRLLLFRANMDRLAQSSADPTKAVATLNFLSTSVLQPNVSELKLVHMRMEIAQHYIRFGATDSAIRLMEALARSEQERLSKVKVDDIQYARYDAQVNHGARRAIVSLVQTAFDQHQHNLSFTSALRLVRLLDVFGIRPPRVYAPYLLHAYALAKQQGAVSNLAPQDWELLGFAAAAVESPARADDGGSPPEVPGYAFEGVLSLLQDMSQAGLDIRTINLETLRSMVTVISSQSDSNSLESRIATLGPTYQDAITSSRRDLDTLSDALTRQSESGDNMSDVSEFTVPTPSENVKIDMYHNRHVDEFYHAGSLVNVNMAFERFLAGVQENKYPTPQTIGHLITSLGRNGDTDKVRYLYTAAQAVLQSSDNKSWQTKSWFTIEDAMVIALAHAGDLAGAHVHRVRILEQGGAPSADAYGALIQYVKDTTDDTSSAITLFEESQMHGVVPNIYLYNNIISKLAKARKADYALELFQRMKSAGLVPSSITYGALIAACARVADHNSAEILFSEMTQQKNFRPRIPPYNTMMQLYTSTKPNRERVLYYYNALLRAGVAPTAHTYKLLIDAYGTIEPLDLDSMQTVFETLAKDPKVQIQGTHWAALINAWGCAKKDLARATQIFDSISTHPNTLKSRAQLPDAVCYEAMINVLVTHRQVNLMPEYIERLHRSGVHMTAYIANFIIKGYANMGNLDKAREMFESMADAPQGMAAPNNHASHDGTTSASPLSPVYREPSTWEVMVRAELGAGNRKEATDLLERLKARNYPEAVYNRISGIMLNDPVSPWSSTSSS